MCLLDRRKALVYKSNRQLGVVCLKGESATLK